MQEHVHSGHTVILDGVGNDLIITADRKMLDLSLGCLIENASDANVDQTAEIRLGCRALSVSDSDTLLDFHGRPFTHGEYLLFEVSDTGNGMSDTVLHRAFDPFFSTKIRGEGMGLPTALGVAWAHEGGMQVETSADKGTAVRIIIPA